MRLSRSPQTSSTSAPAASARSRSAAPWMSETTLMRMAAPSGGSGAGAGAGGRGVAGRRDVMPHHATARPPRPAGATLGPATGEWLGFYAQVFEAVELDGTF